MAPANSTVLVVEQTLKNGHHEYPFPKGESQLPPASGGFPRSANGSDLDPHIILSELGLRF